MTIHNLEGVNLLKNLGFKRVVLSRELSLDEINHICKNSDIEIEAFVHGALCISYSGQCLFSSLIGGRSGNRGKCAQTCRLPYELIEKDIENKERKLDKGYLLSTRDLCSLEYIPELIKAGVTSFKIEGRMKSPEYVATVTRIYRKYIDLAQSNKEYKIDEKDKLDLMQVFNRGGFSSGHLDSKENMNLVFKEKQNNMGLYLGKISKYNKNKGIISTTLENNLSIGDSITFEKEPTKYTISELLNKNQNIKNASYGQTVSLGRMKGNINLGDKIYKISDKELSSIAKNSYQKENIKQDLICNLKIHHDEKIHIKIDCKNFNCSVDYVYDYIPQIAQNASITESKIIDQFNKTLDTEFSFSEFNIDLENNLFIPISTLNDIRRTGISMIREKIIKGFKKENLEIPYTYDAPNTKTQNLSSKISLLLNNLDIDYLKLSQVDKLYIPLKYFGNSRYFKELKYFSDNFNLYIYMPTIIRKNKIDLSKKIIEKSIKEFNLKGFVISNLSQIMLIPECSKNLDIIANYTLNIYNTNSSKTLRDLNFSTITLSPELDEDGFLKLCEKETLPKELIVYGKIPVMTMNYCVLGKSNKCYNTCKKLCNSNNKYYLKDRMGFLFRVIPDNLQTISTIYNSKIFSIKSSDFDTTFSRIDILDENVLEINNIIKTIKNGDRFEGKDFTNGNLRREL